MILLTLINCLILSKCLTLDSNPNEYLECRREEKNERMICGAKSLGIFACLTKSLCHANRSLILLIGRSRPIFSRTEFTTLVFLINAQGRVSAQVACILFPKLFRPTVRKTLF